MKKPVLENKAAGDAAVTHNAVNEPASPAPKLVLCKLILGIVSMVLSVIILFQSCAAGLSNTLQDNGEIGGGMGVLVSLNLIISGIIAVAARKSVSRIPMLIAAALLWLNYFIGKMFGGSFADLAIWGFICYAFGIVYLLSIARTKKQVLIVAAVSAIYLAAALL